MVKALLSRVSTCGRPIDGVVFVREIHAPSVGSHHVLMPWQWELFPTLNFKSLICNIGTMKKNEYLISIRGCRQTSCYFKIINASLKNLKYKNLWLPASTFLWKFLKNYIFTNKIVTSTTKITIFVNKFFPLFLRILA